MIGDKKPPMFEKGQRLTASALNALAESVWSVISRRIGQVAVPQQAIRIRLSSALPAASNAATTPGTSTGVVIEKQPNGELRNTTRTETIVNRFEYIALEQDTLAIAMWIDGEWCLTSADCEPLGASTLIELAGS